MSEMNIAKRIKKYSFNLDDTIDPSYEVITYNDSEDEYFIIHYADVQDEDGYISDSNTVEVLFPERDFVKELRKREYNGDISDEEFLEGMSNLQELDDQYDYGDVVGYRINGGSINWF